MTLHELLRVLAIVLPIFTCGVAVGLLVAHERHVWERSRENTVGRRRALKRLDKDAA